MHQTEDLDDGYMGSGKLITAAIEQYRIENFTKEILFVYDNEAEMKAKEAELVTEELCQSNSCYNLCPGGHGGFGYINSEGLNNSELQRQIAAKNGKKWFLKYNKTDAAKEQKKRARLASSKIRRLIPEKNSFYGKNHSEESKKKIGLANSKHQSGKNNSQYGTMWITYGVVSRKIK